MKKIIIILASLIFSNLAFGWGKYSGYNSQNPRKYNQYPNQYPNKYQKYGRSTQYSGMTETEPMVGSAISTGEISTMEQPEGSVEIQPIEQYSNIE